VPSGTTHERALALASALFVLPKLFTPILSKAASRGVEQDGVLRPIGNPPPIFIAAAAKAGQADLPIGRRLTACPRQKKIAPGNRRRHFISSSSLARAPHHYFFFLAGAFLTAFLTAFLVAFFIVAILPNVNLQSCTDRSVIHI
jgi:hypothetical protein